MLTFISWSDSTMARKDNVYIRNLNINPKDNIPTTNYKTNGCLIKHRG
jgi:hypothetical protein